MPENELRSNTMPEKTEAAPTTAQSANEIKPGGLSGTSQPKKSRRTASESTPLPVRLSILQVALHEYIKNGGQARIVKLPRKEGEPPKVGIILDSVDIVDKNFVVVE